MSKVVVILGFLISFAAGVTVGWRVIPPASLPVATNPGDTKRPDEGGARRGGGDRDPGGWLTEVLKLTPEQQEQLKAIWSETAHEGRREREERRQALKKDRDDLIAKLMVESGKKDEFDWIYARYNQRVEDFDAEWRGKFQAAVERTKAILGPEQRTKYEEILSRHAPPSNGGASGGGNDRSPGRRGETRATSQPDRQTPPQTSRETQPFQGADR
jgi:Spy/CpxP family protein refolding chaperone